MSQLRVRDYHLRQGPSDRAHLAPDTHCLEWTAPRAMLGVWTGAQELQARED